MSILEKEISNQWHFLQKKNIKPKVSRSENKTVITEKGLARFYKISLYYYLVTLWPNTWLHKGRFIWAHGLRGASIMEAVQCMSWQPESREKDMQEGARTRYSPQGHYSSLQLSPISYLLPTPWKCHHTVNPSRD
jgi:hypothetical protein